MNVHRFKSRRKSLIIFSLYKTPSNQLFDDDYQVIKYVLFNRCYVTLILYALNAFVRGNNF